MKLCENHHQRIMQAVQKIEDVTEEEFLGMFKCMQKEIWGKDS